MSEGTGGRSELFVSRKVRVLDWPLASRHLKTNNYSSKSECAEARLAPWELATYMNNKLFFKSERAAGTLGLTCRTSLLFPRGGDLAVEPFACACARESRSSLRLPTSNQQLMFD